MMRLRSPESEKKMPKIIALDFFCGVGGLSFGLQSAGVEVCAGIDIDPACEYPYEANIKNARFVRRDVTTLSAEDVTSLFAKRKGLRLFAGCAPCQPFSSHQKGRETASDPKWSLLDSFGRLVEECLPELVTMENVPRLQKHAVFQRFLEHLKLLDYHVEWKSLHCPSFGIPQDRRRLVLLASRIGPVKMPIPTVKKIPTVRSAISSLPKLANGETDSKDAAHTVRLVSRENLERLRCSVPGGTWKDWPEHLRSACHRRSTGSTFKNVYGRMEWDRPAPTITTLFHNYGTGRFGHPTQDRAISIREGALLQSFPRSYKLVPKGKVVSKTSLARLIGNAVPPLLGQAIGTALLNTAKTRKLA